ncbi:MAG: branched chain amino acid aminotransferase [Gammaproteobacteria bacterium]|nr:MAG: branched chain amino acid aminotransferase [Gammaproteobacteria bacterium]PIE36360.1 MAG: branched chain amino acid aminotransferase [Gammaproteobacteria bacterium]
MAGDFGTRFMPEMTACRYRDGHWGEVEFLPSDKLVLSPGAHVLHYASTCFEGLKAFRHDDGRVALFRIDANVARFAQSSELLYLPPIDQATVTDMITSVVARFRDEVPAPPASMYIRPTHIGTEASIGKAADPSSESLLYVLLSPVGDYFAGGEANLRVLLAEHGGRAPSDHGLVKGGGNYASALKHIMRAREAVNAQQVLFCPDGDVQETGAANFLLIDGDTIITKALDESFLHGVTRASILQIARDRGYTVEERELSVSELLERAVHGDAEAGLSGTAAVLASVGTLIHEGREYTVGAGQPGPRIRELRETLNAIQWGRAEDPYGWVSFV